MTYAEKIGAGRPDARPVRARRPSSSAIVRALHAAHRRADRAARRRRCSASARRARAWTGPTRRVSTDDGRLVVGTPGRRARAARGPAARRPADARRGLPARARAVKPDGDLQARQAALPGRHHQARPRPLLRPRSAEVMVPHVAGRPLNLERYPDGIEGKRAVHPAGARSTSPTGSAARPSRSRAARSTTSSSRSAETLVYLAGQACDHAARVDEPPRPARPPGPAHHRLRPAVDDFAAVRAAAQQAGDLFRECGLEPFAMVTGLARHPRRRAAEAHDRARARSRRSARAIGRACSRERDPDELTTEFRIANRGDRIYVDAGRVRWGHTARRAVQRAGQGRRAGRDAAARGRSSTTTRSPRRGWTLRTLPSASTSSAATRGPTSTEHAKRPGAGPQGAGDRVGRSDGGICPRDVPARRRREHRRDARRQPARPPARAGGAPALGPRPRLRLRGVGAAGPRPVLPQRDERRPDVVRAGAHRARVPAGAALRPVRRQGRRHRDPAHAERAARARERRRRCSPATTATSPRRSRRSCARTGGASGCSGSASS